MALTEPPFLALPSRTSLPLDGDVTPLTISPNISHSLAEPEATDPYFELIWYGITVPILYGFVTVLGVTGNSLVIYVIMTNERMRTVTNLLLLNLAFADLCFVVVIPPPTAYVIAANRWPFGDIPCRLMHYMVNVTAYVTVYTLVLIAAIRYMTIVHTNSTARFRTTGHVIGAIVGVWVLMLTLNVPVLLSYSVKTESYYVDGVENGAAELLSTSMPEVKTAAAAVAAGTAASVAALFDSFEKPEEMTDSISSCQAVDQNTGLKVFVTFFAFAYVLPLCIIAGFSIGIVQHITRHKAPITTVSDRRSITGAGGGSGNVSGTGAMVIANKSTQSANRKRQAGLTLVLVVVMFAVLWLPVHVHLLLQSVVQTTDSAYEAISVLWNLLAYFNSCVNPIIYNRTSKEFRDAFVDACRCGRQQQQQQQQSQPPRSGTARTETRLLVAAPRGSGKASFDAGSTVTRLLTADDHCRQEQTVSGSVRDVSGGELETTSKTATLML